MEYRRTTHGFRVWSGRVTSFDLRGALLGPGGRNLRHMQRQAHVKIKLAMDPDGVEVLIHPCTESRVELVERLVLDLLSHQLASIAGISNHDDADA